MVDRNVIAAESRGTLEPPADMPRVSLVAAGIVMVPHVGSTSGQVRGTQGTNVKRGICMQAHSHTLVMIVVIGRHDSSLRGLRGGVPLLGWIKGAKRA